MTECFLEDVGRIGGSMASLKSFSQGSVARKEECESIARKALQEKHLTFANTSYIAEKIPFGDTPHWMVNWRTRGEDVFDELRDLQWTRHYPDHRSDQRVSLDNEVLQRTSSLPQQGELDIIRPHSQ